ncbi:BTB/POZ domain-containing protein 18 [Candoia aspera]|uniref:BTB/POZ domain-containing protein 18 n=1 Tax=Candoia aspera TaxID=51853 RepID=UPI002FD8623B
MRPHRKDHGGYFLCVKKEVWYMMKEGSATMSSSAANPKILYRNSRLLRMVFLQLHRQQRADLFCDVVLQAEGEAVPAHCCILSACSPFFTEQLEREMPPKGHKVVLEIRGLKIGTLRKLVDFLYTSEMEVSREEAQDIIAAARQLQVSELDSLQLEGGKLVKKTLGRRLNRNCLQLASPVSMSETSLIHSSPSGGSLTSWVAAGKQATSSSDFIPCSKEISSHNSTDQKDVKKQKLTAALLSSDKQISKGQTITADPLKTKVKKHPSGMVRNIEGSNENGGLHRKEAEAGDAHTRASLQDSKKIKLSRPKLSSLPVSVPCATKDHCTGTSRKSSRSVGRLWRQKCPGKDEAKREDSNHLRGFWSPPLLPKSTKGRKRTSSEPMSSSNRPQEVGQIGRVKLRKVINGSCWEVVQESPAMQPTMVANAVCTLKDEGSQSQPRRPKPEGADVQQLARSAKLLPATVEAAPGPEKSVVELPENKVALDEGDSAAGNHYDMNAFMLDHLTKGEQYDSLASAGELEQMLDLLLADEDATAGIQSTTTAQGLCASPHANENALRTFGIEEKEKCCTVGPQLEKIKISLPQEAPELKITKNAGGSTNGGPLLDPVLSYLPLVTAEPNGDCLSLCMSASPQLGDWTAAQCQLSESTNGTAKFAEPLPVTWMGDENQGLLTYDVGISDAEMQSLTEAVLSNGVQHHLDCKLPSFLASLEEENIDVGGVEELFLNIECVRPDPSPISETEVDVLSYFFTEKCIQVQ